MVLLKVTLCLIVMILVCNYAKPLALLLYSNYINRKNNGGPTVDSYLRVVQLFIFSKDTNESKWRYAVEWSDDGKEWKRLFTTQYRKDACDFVSNFHANNKVIVDYDPNRKLLNEHKEEDNEKY